MRVLAFDTAATTCSAAVVTEDGTLALLSHPGDQSHSRRLMVLIETVLGAAGVAVEELDGFAVTVGPGSFTGLRIGLSSAHGLAAATGKPVVGISSLEALACPVEASGPRCAMLDARRTEVYAAVYHATTSGLIPVFPERVGPPGDLVPRFPPGCSYVGSGAVLYRDIILRHDSTARFCQDPEGNRISAAAVGRLAIEKMTHADGARLPLPRYIRRSDAEPHGSGPVG